MSSVVYPLGESRDTYTLLNSSFSNKKYVKIKNFGTDPCSLDALLMSISREYQNCYDSEKRESITNKFKQEFKNFIVSPGEYSEQNLIKKFMTAYNLSSLKNQFRLKAIGEMKTIYDLIIIKKPNDNDKYLDYRISYPLFSKETKKLFLPNSNIFSLLDNNFLKDMIEQRFIAKSYHEKIKKLEELLDQEEDPVMMKEMEQYREIMDFNMSRKNNLSPENLINIIDSDFCKNEDIILRFVSCILKFNIYLCRSWNTEISVIKKMVWKPFYNYIILFKTDTPVSLTGMKSEVRYETGGVKISQNVVTVIDSEKNKTVIEDLNKILNNDIDSYYSEKYITYLNKLQPNTTVEMMDMSYDDDGDETETEMNDETETEMNDETETEDTSEISENFQFLDETGKTENKIRRLERETKRLERKIEEEELKEDIERLERKIEEEELKEKTDFFEEEINTENEETENSDTYIPSFIKGYTDTELIDLLKIFVNPDGNYKNVSRNNLELMYKNYLINNSEENVDDIIEKIKNY